VGIDYLPSMGTITVDNAYGGFKITQ